MSPWMNRLERRLGWLAIPQIAVILVTLQALGFLMVASNPAWRERLALFPTLVLEGEFWRVITFLALPISMSPIFIIFVLWFLYFIVNTIEQEWGAFKTTLYVLVSYAVTVAFSFVFGYPVTHIGHFESTLFLAAAMLYPEFEVQLFLIFPVKMKWLAAVTAVFAILELVQGTWMDRLFLLAIYSNFILFFGPAMVDSLRLRMRRRGFLNRSKR